MKVKFCAFASDLGEKKNISETLGQDIDEGTLSILKLNGLHSYRKTKNIVDNIKTSVKKSLNLCSLEKSDIQAAFFATEMNVDSSVMLSRNDCREILFECGIENATIIGTSHSACANTTVAMAQADGLIRNSTFESAIIISYFAISQNETRLMPPSIGFLSDGAASCIVTSDDINQSYFILDNTRFKSDLTLGSYNDLSDFAQAFQKIGQGIKSLSEDFQNYTQKNITKYDIVIMNNMCLSSLKMFSLQLGLNDDNVYKDMIPETSHVSACDVLINIEKLLQEKRIENDNTLLLFATGPTNWVISDLIFKKG